MSFLGSLFSTLNNYHPPLSSFLDLWLFTPASFQLPWLGMCLYGGAVPESGPPVSSERTSCLGQGCKEGMDRFSLLTNTASLLIPRWHFTLAHSSTVSCAWAVPESCFTSVPSQPALLLPKGSISHSPLLSYAFAWPHTWVHGCPTPGLGDLWASAWPLGG